MRTDEEIKKQIESTYPALLWVIIELLLDIRKLLVER